MTSFKYLSLFIVLGFYDCGQNKNRNNPAAIALNDKIVPLTRYLDNPDSCKKALAFLDSATTIDSTCFLCYYNKLMFLNSLKQYDKAILTITRLVELKPRSIDLYLKGGVYYAKTGDTASANAFFQKSLSICNEILDTMHRENKDYVAVTVVKALNIIMLGNQSKGNEILAILRNQETDSNSKNFITSMMNKTKDDLLEISRDKTANSLSDSSLPKASFTHITIISFDNQNPGLSVTVDTLWKKKRITHPDSAINISFCHKYFHIPYYVPTNGFYKNVVKERECDGTKYPAIIKCYSYDSLNRVIRMSVNGSGTTNSYTYKYDNKNNVIEITDHGHGIFVITYNPDNTIAELKENNLASEKKLVFIYSNN